MDDYIDLNDPVWNKSVMEQMKYNGRYYNVPKDVVAFYIYYNKSMFENNGIKTPSEYYKEGTWNWENFKKSAIALTQDTNADGAIDQWGFNTGRNEYSSFFLANGADMVEFKDDGSIELALNNPKMMNALQLIQDGVYKHKYFSPNSNLAAVRDEFQTGKVAMVAERKNTLGDNFKADMKYEWDIVPFPSGPDVKTSIAPAASGSWGIPTGAKNPQGAAAWLLFYISVFE